MKTNILFILLVLLINACDEGFLDIPSETELNISSYYKTQADFEQAINGSYAALRDVYDERNFFSLGELRGDNAYYDYNADNRGQIEPEFVADFLSDAANGEIDDKFYDNYTVIDRANQILITIDDVDFDDQDVKDNIKGQALFLRALSYFHLVQFYGSIPLHLETATTMEETALPLSSVDAVYTQIIIDATNAISLLPESADQEVGRATKGAAQTLLGNVYVVREDWTNAVTVLSQVIGKYSLVTSGYRDVFDPRNKNNEESIFEIQFLGTDNDAHSTFPFDLLPAAMFVDDVADITGDADALDRNVEGMVPTPDLIAAYEAGDLRYDATVGLAVSVPNGTDTIVPYVKKYIYPGTHSQYGWADVNMPVYRYADVLLLLAEALNESGSSSDALPHLNAIRGRAGLGDVTTTDQTALRTAIIAERRFEFAFEGKRWLDLVRTGTAESVMKAFGANVKADPEAYYFPAGIAPPTAAYSTIDLLFPIPSEEVALNPNY